MFLMLYWLIYNNWSTCHVLLMCLFNFHWLSKKYQRSKLAIRRCPPWWNLTGDTGQSTAQLSMCNPGHCCLMEIVAMKDNNSSLLPSGYCLALYNQCVHNQQRTNNPLHSSIKSPHPQAHLLSPTLTKQLYFSGRCSSKYSACVCRSDLYWSSSEIMLSGALRLLLTCF